MNEPADLLQIRIEKAKAQLPKETREAIDAVDWKGVILGMRAKKGYSFEQLGTLELETELLFCGLVNPDNYPKEIEIRLKIPRAKAEELVNEMNELVFKKIRDELMKRSERKKIQTPKTAEPHPNPLLDKERVPEAGEVDLEIKKGETQILNDAGIQITTNEPSITSAKLSGSFQIPAVKTEHSLENISRPRLIEPEGSSEPERPNPLLIKERVPKAGEVDPYRMPVEEEK